MEISNIIIVCIIIIIYYEYRYNSLYESFVATRIESNTDKRKYNVAGLYSDTLEASNTMADINNFIFEFLKFLRNKYIFKKFGTYYEQDFVKRVLKNYNPDVIFENNPNPGEDTSYVTNKGKEFALCLRDRKTKKIHDFNLLQFVTIHELSHLGNIDFGHGYSFWSWMKFMLIQANESGLYIPKDYSKNHIVYCGLEVTFSPFYSNKYNWHIAHKQRMGIRFQENY